MKTTKYFNDNTRFDFFEKDYFNRLEEIVTNLKNQPQYIKGR